LLTANTYKNLITSGPETVQRLPQIVFSSLTQPIANTGLFYKIDSSYDYLWREEGEKGHRIDIFPKISLPLSLNGWLKHTTVIGLRGMYYIDIDDDDGLDTDVFFPSITSELTAKFYRIYTVKRSWLKKIRHSIEPGVRYEYIATEDQTDYPEFDIPERFFRRHEVSYFIKNRLSALLRGSDGSTDEREIGYFLIGNAHNIQEPKGGIYRDGDHDEDFSDLFGELRIGIFPRLYLKIKAAYNPYDNFVRYHNYLLSWSTLRGSYIQFQYRYYKKFYEVFDLRGNLKLTNALSLFFDSLRQMFSPSPFR
jgi:LPS-assembly protein